MSHHSTVDELHNLTHNPSDEFVYNQGGGGNSDRYDTIENTQIPVNNTTAKESTQKKGGWKRRVALYSITMLFFLSMMLIFGFHYKRNQGNGVDNQKTLVPTTKIGDNKEKPEKDQVNVLSHLQDDKGSLEEIRSREVLGPSSKGMQEDLKKGNDSKEDRHSKAISGGSRNEVAISQATDNKNTPEVITSQKKNINDSKNKKNSNKRKGQKLIDKGEGNVPVLLPFKNNDASMMESINPISSVHPIIMKKTSLEPVVNENTSIDAMSVYTNKSDDNTAKDASLKEDKEEAISDLTDDRIVDRFTSEIDSDLPNKLESFSSHVDNVRKSTKETVQTALIDFYQNRRETYLSNQPLVPNLLFLKFHKVGGSSFSNFIEYLYKDILMYHALEEDQEYCNHYTKALVKATEIEKKTSVCSKHPGLEFATTAWKTLNTIINEIDFPDLEGNIDEKELNLIKEETIRETIATSNFSYSIFTNFGKTQQKNYIALMLRHPVSKLNSYFYYRKFLSMRRERNRKNKKKGNSKNLLEKRNCWGEQNPWQSPRADENVNDWIRRLYEESQTHPELIQCLNEYSNILVRGSSSENAKVILDKIDLVLFTEEFEIAEEKLLNTFGLPKDSFDGFETTSAKKVPSSIKKNVSEIGNNEMKLLRELLRNDIELYEYAFEKYSDYAKEHPGQVKPFH